MTDMIFFKGGEESFRIPFPTTHGTKCPETKLEVKKMTDEEFLKQTATKAANILHMPLGDIDPLKLLQMFIRLDVLMGGDAELMIHWVNTHNKHLGYCPGAHLTDARMDNTIRYLEGMIER
jgi:hypothetical protein